MQAGETNLRRTRRSALSYSSYSNTATGPSSSSSSSSSSDNARQLVVRRISNSTGSQVPDTGETILGRRSTRSSSSLNTLTIVGRRARPFHSDSSLRSPTNLIAPNPSARGTPVISSASPRSPSAFTPTAVRHPEYVSIPTTVRRETIRSTRSRPGINNTNDNDHQFHRITRRASLPPLFPPISNPTDALRFSPEQIPNPSRSRSDPDSHSPDSELATVGGPSGNAPSIPVRSDTSPAVRTERQGARFIRQPSDRPVATSLEGQSRLLTILPSSAIIVTTYPTPNSKSTFDYAIAPDAVPRGDRPTPLITIATVQDVPTSSPPRDHSTGSISPIGRSDSPSSLIDRLALPPTRSNRSQTNPIVSLPPSPRRREIMAPTNNHSYMAAAAFHSGPSSSSSESSASSASRTSSTTRFPSPCPSMDSLTDMSASITPSMGHKPSPFELGVSGPLACKAEIVLEKGGNVMSMFGGPRTGVAYSLPGHVVISVPNLPTGAGSVEQGGAGRQRELKSLEIVFEGKSEFFDEAGRYQTMRLVQIRKSILPDSAESRILPHRPTTSHQTAFPQADTKYAMAFDLAIPGWLPASFENDVSSVSYGVVCFATIGWAKEGIFGGEPRPMSMRSEMRSAPVNIPTTLSLPSNANTGFRTMLTRGLSSAINSFSTSQWPVSTRKSVQTSWSVITINRHRAYAAPNRISPDGEPAPAPVPPPEHTLRHFTLKPSEDSPSPVECLISVPDTVDINGPNVRIGVRIRARRGFVIAGPETAQARARPGATVPGGTMQAADGADAPEDFDMDQDPAAAGEGEGSEGETTGSASPAKRPLGIIRMVELGMEIEEIERYTSTPAQPFLAAYPIPEEQPNAADPSSGPHALLSPPSRLAEMHSMGLSADPSFKGTRSRTLLLGDDGKPRSYKFDKEGLELGAGWRKVNVIVPMPSEEVLRAGGRRPLSEVDSPFARIKHKLKIRITCRCSTMPGKDTLVVLTTPLRCGTAPMDRPLDLPYITGQSAHPLADMPLSLPAYNQIFHENGATREDDDPLPIYDAVKEDAPAYTLGREFARTSLMAQGRLSTPAREAMDLSRGSSPENVGSTGSADASAVEQLVSSHGALSGVFASPSASTANSQSSSFLFPPTVSSSFTWTPTTSSGDIPMPRPSPLSWSHTPIPSPSSSPNPLGSAIGMSMMTGPSDLSMDSDLEASTSSLRDVMGSPSGQAGPRRIAKPIEVPVGRGGPAIRRPRSSARLQLGLPPAARRR